MLNPVSDTSGFASDHLRPAKTWRRRIRLTAAVPTVISHGRYSRTQSPARPLVATGDHPSGWAQVPSGRLQSNC